MVMRPDVWGAALDDVLDERATLVVPTPSGPSFTQRTAEDWATRPQARVRVRARATCSVAEHYREAGVRVEEASIGTTSSARWLRSSWSRRSRLLPGVASSPESVVEESHSQAGLLEYPVYEAAGVAGPRGPCRADERARQGSRAGVGDQAIVRTADGNQGRQVSRIDVDTLDKLDRALLAELGWHCSRAQALAE